MPASPEPATGALPLVDQGFHTTHWTIVFAARNETASSQEALASLCSRYWYPLYAYIRRTGATPHEAEDLTQGFFCRLLQYDWLAKVHPSGGKFRSFLLACVKNFLANERDKVLAQRRGGGVRPLPLECEEAETRYMFEPPDPITPELLFERQWVFELLQQTVRTLREEYTGSNRQDLFEDLQGFLPGGEEKASRAEIAEKRGLSANALDVAIHRLRQRFGALLRQRVAETVSSDSEVDAEIRHLMTVLSK